MLHLFTRFLVLATLVLLVAGGLVTSTGSGLAVPDWPNTYGWFMFSFPLSKMVGGIFYEHGHRLIASTVGFLTIILTVWLWFRDGRLWVRRLGVIALAAVITQGLLGGLTVLFFLPAPISIAHAGLAQFFFCLVVSLAVLTSRGWIEGYGQTAGFAENAHGVRDSGFGVRKTKTSNPESQIPNPGDSMRQLRTLAIATTAAIYLQILLGATMRHTGAGLAIPDFPLAFGRLAPPLDRLLDAAVAIHFTHRAGAVAVAVMVVALAWRIWKHHRERRELVRPVQALLVLFAVQVALGGLTVLSQKAVSFNTAHVVTGALVLGTSLVIALRAHRGLFAKTVDSGQLTVGGVSLEEGRAAARPVLRKKTAYRPLPTANFPSES